MRTLRLLAALFVALLAVGSFAVLPASASPATHLVVSTVTADPVGGAVSVTVTAVDGTGATDTGYADTVAITSSDGAATLPASSTLTNGVGTFSVTLNTAGTRTITATGTTTTTITGSTSLIVYGPATRLAVSATSSVPQYGAATVTVTAVDANGNTVRNSSDVVQLTSSDTSATLPAAAALTNGVGTFSVTLNTAGNQTVTAADDTSGSVSSGITSVSVYGAVTQLVVSVPSATAGAVTTVTVRAADSLGDTVSSFTDLITLTTTDTKAEYTTTVTPSAGVATFAVRFHTSGLQTLHAYDATNTALTGSAASYVSDKPLTRLAGDTRIATAIAASQDEYANAAASAVVLARADDYADALAGGPLAVAKNGPLLLTTSASLDATVLAEIQRVLPAGDTVYLLGGTTALDPSIADTLTASGYTVVRLAGNDRYATATAVAVDGLGSPATVLLATGTSYADALAAAPAAAKLGAALLLTNGSTLPDATAAYLASHSGSVYAIGGPAAAADPSAVAVSGADRYETAAMVAWEWFPSTTTVGIASGSSFADALAGSAHVAKLGGAMLLVDPNSTTLPSSTYSFVTGDRDSSVRGYVYGGSAAVNAALFGAVQTALD